MNLHHYSARYLLHTAWTEVLAGRLDGALRTYEYLIGTAPSSTPELRTALIGAGSIHYLRGEPEQAATYAHELSSSSPVEQVHPKDRQLYIPIEDLLQCPYLRQHEVWCSSPGRFNPAKKHMGNQAIIVATTWEKRPDFYGRGYTWIATIYWLKDYDPPYSYRVYTGGDSRPCEAVDPISVMEAVGLPLQVMIQYDANARGTRHA